MELISGLSSFAAATVDLVGDGNNTLTNDVVTIVNVVIGALGLVAVVVIVVGGISYMTSSGDASKVKRGKDTILYGVIGLIICALAFAIVNWVISGLLGNGNNGGDRDGATGAHAECLEGGGEWRNGKCNYAE